MNDEHLRKIQKDVDEMNKAFSFEVPEDDKTDPPATDAPMDDKTDPPSTDSPADAPKTAPPSTDQPEDKDETIRKLREKLAEGDKETVPKTKAPSTKPPTTDAPLQDVDFVGDLDLEDVSENKEEMNKLLNKIYQEAVKTKGVDKTPDIIAAIPAVVTAVTTLQKATETFYKENPDLEPFKKVVGVTFEELVEKNPNKTYDELIKDVAPLARKKLELPDPKKKKGKEAPPRLPRRKGQSGRQDNVNEPTSTQSQIEEMNKSLGR